MTQYKFKYLPKLSDAEKKAAEIVLDTLRTQHSHLAILSNYLYTKSREIDPCHIIEPDLELCMELGFEPGSEGEVLSTYIKPFLSLLKTNVIQRSKQSDTPKFTFIELLKQMLESDDEYTRNIIISMMEDEDGLYTAEEKETMKMLHNKIK